MFQNSRTMINKLMQDLVRFEVKLEAMKNENK